MKFSAVQKFTVLDYPGKVACIVFTPGCNMRCEFCHNPEFVLPEHIKELRESFISEATVLRFLEKRRGLLDGVVVSGGEPTLWHDLSKFLGKLQERGFLVKLDTNGNNPEMLRKLLREKLVDYVAMDVKASLGGYATLVGRGVKPEHIQESIELLKASGIPYEFRTTLIQEVHTEMELVGLEQLVAGAREYYLQIFRPGHTLSPVFAGYHPFSPEEMEMLAKRFGKLVGKIGVRSES